MTDTINGRTPEEIKRGLECCIAHTSCDICPYLGTNNCMSVNTADAISYIRQLERERDAAVSDLENNKRCETCINYTPGYFCLGCRQGSNWQWRGVQEVE